MKMTESRRLRISRKNRVKTKLQRHQDRPRLSVFKSAKHIYAQIIDDKTGRTLVSASTMAPDFREQMKNGGNVKAAVLVGSMIGERAAKEGIKEVVYDRNGFIYTGRVKALADAVREKGVKF